MPQNYGTESIPRVNSVMLTRVREEVEGGYELANRKDAKEIIGIPQLKEQICKELAKLYTRCVRLRNGYLRHYHRDGDTHDLCTMKVFKKYRPNLQYKLIYEGTHAAAVVEQKQEKEQVKVEEDDEDCVLALCHVLESGNLNDWKELENMMKSMSTAISRDLIKLMRENSWILNCSSNQITVLQLLVYANYIGVLEMLLNVSNGLMIPPSKEGIDGDEEDELLRQEMPDFLSRQDTCGGTALHFLSSNKDRERAQTITRLFTDFCYHIIDVENEKKDGSRSFIPFINRLLSIRSPDDGRTVLTMLLASYNKEDSDTDEEEEEPDDILRGFLDAMQLELMRQGRWDDDEGLDVSWLLTADKGDKGRTPFHYKCARLVRILPAKHLRPHSFFQLCTARDSFNGSTPLRGLCRKSDAEFCSALVLLSKQVQAFDDERRRYRRRQHSSSSLSPSATTTSINTINIAINLLSSGKTSGSTTGSWSWKEGTADLQPPDAMEVAAGHGSLVEAGTNVSTSSTREKHPSVHRHPQATVDKDFLHALVHAQDDDGRTPLHTAEGRGCINELLRFGASVAEPDRAGNDVLTATFEGLFSQEVLKSIRSVDLEASSKKQKKKKTGRSSRSSSSREGRLLSNVKAKYDTCGFLLQWACPLDDSFQMLPERLLTGVINKRIGRLGLTALHVAAAIGSSERVEILLERGAHVNVRCRSGGRTPLHMATSQGLSSLVSTFRSSDLDCSPSCVISRLTFCDMYDDTGFKEVPSYVKGNLQMEESSEIEKQDLDRLLREYIDTQDFSGRTCLHNLVENFEFGEFPLGNVSKISVPEPLLMTERIREKSTSFNPNLSNILKHCIQRLRCHVQLGDRAGDTLLHVAVAKCDDFKMVRNIIGWASLRVAAATSTAGASSQKDEEVIEMMSKSEWLLMGNASEETALHVAVRMGKMQMVKVLLEAAMEMEVMEEMLWRRKDMLHMSAADCMNEAASKQGQRDREKTIIHYDNPQSWIDAYCNDINIESWIEAYPHCCFKPVPSQSPPNRAAPAEPQSLRISMDHFPPPFQRRLVVSPPPPRLLQQPQQLQLHYDDHDPSWRDLQQKLSDQPTLIDELGRSRLVNGIVDILLNPSTSTPLTVGILGNWGAGKTSFMKQVEVSSLVLNTRRNTREKEMKRDPGDTVQMSPRAYRAYKAKAFLKGIIRGDRKPTPKVPVSIVTIWYNAWHYDGKTEASAGLALEVCKELEDLMTPTQWLRMCCAYVWEQNRKGITMSLILPMLLAMGLIILALTIAEALHVPVTYAASMGVLGVLGVLFNATTTIAPSVAMSMTAPGTSTDDHTAMVGYQHRVITDILFLQSQLCTKAAFPWKAIDLFGRCLSKDYYFKGTRIRKECPSQDNLRIIVFMDDIDRCEEKTVLELLRAINIVANACRITVVLGANEQIIHGAISREFSPNEKAVIAAETTQRIESKSDGKLDSPAQEDDLAERFMKKIIQIPIRIKEPGDKELEAFVQGISGYARRETTKYTGRAADVKTDANGDGNDCAVAAVSTPNVTRGIITPAEYKILASLLPSTHGDRRLPRECKRFMNYHQVARSVILTNQLAAPNEPDKFKGWPQVFILWLFVCWNWKTEMNILIQEWSDITRQMRKQLLQDKENAVLGDVVGCFMEKKGWKGNGDLYPIKVDDRHIDDHEVLAWVNLYNAFALIAHFDIPFKFIDLFQEFRYDCNSLHLPFDLH